MKLIIVSLAFCLAACAPAAQPSSELIPPIVRYNSEVNPDGSYQWNFEPGNGISAQEKWQVEDGPNPEEGGMEDAGSYKYTNADDPEVQVSDIVNDNEFQPQPDIIPTPIPIPSKIERALEWLAVNPEA